jgi:hypothetical protein
MAQGVYVLNNKQLGKFLRVLCEIYQNENGHSQAKLSDWCFSYSIVANHKRLEKIIKENFTDDKFGDGLELIFQELVERGFLESKPDCSSYCIIKPGYEEGTSSCMSKFLNFFNINPGINTLIAILSLIIALAALYVSIKKP